MKTYSFSFVPAFLIMVGFFFLAGCNGKIDQDLIDSITGKVPVERITIDQENFEMRIGADTILTATVLPEDVTDRTIIWSSSNEDVLIVSSVGKAMAIAPGKAVVTAKAGIQTDFITIAVIANEDPVSPVNPSVTVGAEHISAVSVLLKGRIDIKEIPFDFTYGFQYKKGMDGDLVEVEAKGADEQFNYSLGITRLEPASQYTFRSFCRLEGKASYGEPMTFTTKELSSLVYTHSASELTALSFCMNARLDDELLYATSSVEYGFRWGTSNTSLDNNISCGNLTNQTYFAVLAKLLPSTQYVFKASVKVDGKEYVGETKTFTTREVTDLSSDATANCYIVSEAGGYMFKAVQGNSSASVGAVAGAEVLWESYGTDMTPSVGDIISNVSYINNNTIIFSTPLSLTDGNAVIAAKDANGTVLWSWHIWVCKDYDPIATAQEYYNNAGIMMDRNLGATSAMPGNVGALGLLYQWGRKDPFLGSSSISSSTKAASTLTWPTPVSSDSSTGTIEYAVKNPTTFIKYNSNNEDWYYTDSGYYTDNTRWQSSKTIYDPCPPGWKVPAGGSSGVWSKAVNTSSSFSHTWDSTHKGMNFSGKFGSAETIWYPAAGCLSRDDGDVYNVGSYGYWWSCTPYGNYAYCLRRDLYSVGVVRPSAYFNRAYGLSVRCASDVSSPSLEPTLGSADDAEPASYPASERDSGHSMNTSGVKSIQGIPYTYEFWMDGGRGQMTYYNDGTFMSMFNTVSDCLARVGYRYNFPNGPGVDHKTKNYVVDFKAVKSGNASYGYIGAYGWTANPQMEFYIVDDWFGTSALVYQGTKKGEITVNGATYDIYTVQRTNAPSVTGPSNFVQVWSVRRTARQKGRIHISEHFSKWEELGIGSINPVEVSFLCEVGGNATGSFECTYLDFKEYFPY